MTENHDVIIRDWEPVDAAACHAIYVPFVTDTVITFEYDPPSLDEYRRRFEKFAVDDPVLVAEFDGTVVGFAYATQLRWKPAYQWTRETTIYLAPESRGRGWGRVLYTALIDLMTLQGTRRIYGITSDTSGASGKFHEMMGFTFETRLEKSGFKLGRWIPIDWYVLEIPGEDPPAEFVSASELRGRTEWNAVLGPSF